MIKLADVHFLSARSLAEKLNKRSVSEEAAFSHFLLASMIFGANVGVSPSLLLEQISSPAKAVIFIIQLLIQYWGITLLYKTNKLGDGEDFFLRLAALSLPVTVQMLPVAAIVGFGVAQLGGALLALDLDSSQSRLSILNAVGIVGGVLIGVTYFLLMRSYLTTAASLSGDNQP